MGAYHELRAWAESMAGPGSSLPARDSWQLAVLDPATARRAAVLILLGERAAMPQDRAVPPSAARGPARTADHGDLDLLFVMRAGSLNHHPGQVAFPGGAIDEDDLDETAAALREAQEETGLDPHGVEVLGGLPEIGLPVSNFLVTPVLGWWAEQSAVHAVDTAESELVFRAPVSALLDPGRRRTAVVRRNGLTSRTPAFILPEAVVWGFTAMLLESMFEGPGWPRPGDAGREIPAPL
ncbi:NUDIX hydrolase [Arthrobacter sp. RIT-PI-e]|uniref:NUDIX hydrolase n=1 Tax=Arthrobacter sp. RIT-PI-e TaxID=1681197 RepID=UPI001F32F3E6|nr:CoA pyrophosphatase [Arthrobacter sp. RIT-PI-e]